MPLKRRRKKKKPQVVDVNCRYCDCFWTSPSRVEGGKQGTVYRNCRRFGQEVTGDTKICEHFALSNNIQCEKFSNRVAHVCCLARRKHGYADEYCTKKCPQVAVIQSSYAVMGQSAPEPRRPDSGRISAHPLPIPTRHQPVVSNRQKRLIKRRKRESSGRTVKKLTRRPRSTPIVKKLRRRRQAG